MPQTVNGFIMKELEAFPHVGDGFTYRNLKIEISKIARPGMMFSGSVTLANGSTADWYLDNMGRLGVDNLQGDQPGQEDIEKFQMALQIELRKLMGR